MRHHCHASECTTPCRPTLLMCPRHWAMVPIDLQRRVIATYRRGQCDDKSPSGEWIAAAHTAITVVALAEGRCLHVMRAIKAYDSGVRHPRLSEVAIDLARRGGLENIQAAFAIMNPAVAR